MPLAPNTAFLVQEYRAKLGLRSVLVEYKLQKRKSKKVEKNPVLVFVRYEMLEFQGSRTPVCTGTFQGS